MERNYVSVTLCEDQQLRLADRHDHWRQVLACILSCRNKQILINISSDRQFVLQLVLQFVATDAYGRSSLIR